MLYPRSVNSKVIVWKDGSPISGASKSSDGMKPDQSPLNLSCSLGLATENTTIPSNLSRSPGLAAENTTMSLPKPKNMKLD